MRTYGRTYDEEGNPTWVLVESTPEAGDDYVWLTTLAQCCSLSINESPFYANYGIPAQQSVIQQVFPDYYLAQMQTLFAPYFASLIIGRQTDPAPTYRINVVTNQGVPLEVDVPV